MHTPIRMAEGVIPTAGLDIHMAEMITAMHTARKAAWLRRGT